MDDDYIRRDEVLSYFEGLSNMYGGDSAIKLNRAIAAMKEIPAVVARPVVHGRWKPITAAGHKCSNCDAHFIGDMTDWEYCPHCGADMREG